MSEMVERVARAIASDIFGEEIPKTAKTSLEGAARAAIEAMREPTEAMRAAGLMAGNFGAEHEDDEYAAAAGCCWDAMIDAALA